MFRESKVVRGVVDWLLGGMAVRIGEPFPGQSCEICGGALVFDREPSKNAYVLRCPRRCGQTLVLPEANLLETIKRLPSAIAD